MRLGNLVGKVVKVDETTMMIVRGKFAQVCVEIDLHKPLVSFMAVIGYLQLVEYEELYQICFRYNQYGHKDENCPKLGKNLDE